METAKAECTSHAFRRAGMNGEMPLVQGTFPFRLSLFSGKARPHQLNTVGQQDHLDFAENLIDGGQLLPRQPSPPCSRGEGWQKKTSPGAPSNTFQHKPRSGWGPSSVTTVCARNQLRCLPGTVKSNVVC